MIRSTDLLNTYSLILILKCLARWRLGISKYFISSFGFSYRQKFTIFCHKSYCFCILQNYSSTFVINLVETNLNGRVSFLISDVVRFERPFLFTITTSLDQFLIGTYFFRQVL